jgi:hypothetical protein
MHESPKEKASRIEEMTTIEKPLTWERLDVMVTCRINNEMGGISYFDEDTWPKMNEFLHEHFAKMENAV